MSSSGSSNSINLSSSEKIKSFSSDSTNKKSGLSPYIWIGVGVGGFLVVVVVIIGVIAVIFRSKRNNKEEQELSSTLELSTMGDSPTSTNKLQESCNSETALITAMTESTLAKTQKDMIPHTASDRVKSDEPRKVGGNNGIEKYDDDEEDDDEDVEAYIKKKDLKPTMETFKMTAPDLSKNDEWSRRLPMMVSYEWSESPVTFIPLSENDVDEVEELLISNDRNGIIEYGKKHVLKNQPPELCFGNRGEQVPVNQELKQKIILVSNDSQMYSFNVIKRKYPKFIISASPEIGKLTKKKCALELTLTLKMRCTTSVELCVPIVFWRGSLKNYEKLVIDGSSTSEEKNQVFVCYLRGKIQSQLSTRIDIEDLVLYNPPIGHGAYGTVYRGQYRALDIACKVLKDQDLMTEDDFESFSKEVNMFETLRHPCIVNYVGAVFIPGSLALVTELCQYGSLTSAMKEHGPKVWNTKMKIKALYDCARAMNFLHHSSIIHRDLKPDNLLVISLNVSSPVLCKLSDFGTTKGANTMMSDMTMTKGVGTPLYMAPELMKGEKHYTMKVDVYSFGIMIASVVDDGATPYEDDSRVESAWQLSALVAKGLRPQVKKAKEMPPDLVALMERCWADDPSVRPEFDVIVSMLDKLLQQM